MREPKILLLDEPLSNLDAKLREQMRVELKRLQTRLGITTVYVTHDQSEALALSDEIAVFNSGKIVQRGTPQDIYRKPKSQFVADFIGSANFLAGTAKEGGGDRRNIAGSRPATASCSCIFAQARRARAGGAGQRAAGGPAFCPKIDPADGLNVLAGKIAHRVFFGEVVDYLVDTGEGEIRVRTQARIGLPDRPAGPCRGAAAKMRGVAVLIVRNRGTAQSSIHERGQAMNTAKVTGLRSIELGVTNLNQSAAFYNHVWGLDPVVSEGDTIHLRANGAEHHIVTLRERPKAGMLGVHFAAADKVAVECAARQGRRRWAPR